MKRKLICTLLAGVLTGLCGCGQQAVSSPPSGSVMPDSGKWVDYAGAVLPMTGERVDGLSAQRSLELDFSKWSGTSGAAQVDDIYVLTNPTEEPVNATLYYPISTSLTEFPNVRYAVSVDGKDVKANNFLAVTKSAYGRFEIYSDGYDDPYWVGETLEEIMQECYTREPAFICDRDLSQVKAYRYTITDIQYDSFWPLSKEAALCLEFVWDSTDGVASSYGFGRNGGDGGTYFQSSVLARKAQEAVVTTIGAPLTDYTLTGYATLAWGDHNRLPKLTARLTEEELTAEQLLEESLDACLAQREVFADRDLLLAEAKRQTAERLERMEPLLAFWNWSYFLYHEPVRERLLWLEIPIAFEPGEEHQVTVSYQCSGGVELGGPASRKGVWHYDILPDYGTELTITDQVVTLTGGDQIAVSSAALGRELKEGLVPTQEFYHFAVEEITS